MCTRITQRVDELFQWNVSLVQKAVYDISSNPVRTLQALITGDWTDTGRWLRLAANDGVLIQNLGFWVKVKDIRVHGLQIRSKSGVGHVSHEGLTCVGVVFLGIVLEIQNRVCWPCVSPWALRSHFIISSVRDTGNQNFFFLNLQTSHLRNLI